MFDGGFVKLYKVTDNSEMRKYIGLLYSELFDEQAVPSEDLFDNIFSQLKDPNNNHDAYCLKENNETVAFFTLSESFSIFAHGRYGIINELWVNKEFRSQGVGKTVIQEILKIGFKRSWKRIDVSAPTDEKWDRTFNFYRNNGFTFTGRKLKICL
jgi:ribosomal protein S18 acetylase RimI-like enzyme